MTTERNGTERKRESARAGEFVDEDERPEPVVPTIEEGLAFTRAGPGIPDGFARHYVDKCCVKKRWLTKTPRGVEIIDWRREIVMWWAND